MKRLSSQLIITESAETLRNSVVELNNYAISYQNILTHNHETAHTLFYDGILSPIVISLAAHGITKREIENTGYKIVLIEDIDTVKSFEDKKTIIDLKTDNPLLINDLIKKHHHVFCRFNSIDFIIACTVLPQLVISDFNSMSECRTLWSGTNLADKKITAQTSVSIV